MSKLPRNEILRLAMLDAAVAFRKRCASMAADIKPLSEDTDTRFMKSFLDIFSDETGGTLEGVRLTAEIMHLKSPAKTWDGQKAPDPNR